MWDFIVRVVKTQDSLKIKGIFASNSREDFPQSEACAQHMI